MVPKLTTAPAGAIAAPNTTTRPPQPQGQRSHKRPKTQLDQQPAPGSHAQAYEAAGEATMRRKRPRDEGGERLETRAGPPTPPAETKTTRVVLLKDKSSKAASTDYAPCSDSTTRFSLNPPAGLPCWT